jgi:hypothetical protein
MGVISGQGVVRMAQSTVVGADKIFIFPSLPSLRERLSAPSSAIVQRADVSVCQPSR